MLGMCRLTSSMHRHPRLLVGAVTLLGVLGLWGVWAIRDTGQEAAVEVGQPVAAPPEAPVVAPMEHAAAPSRVELTSSPAEPAPEFAESAAPQRGLVSGRDYAASFFGARWAEARARFTEEQLGQLDEIELDPSLLEGADIERYLESLPDYVLGDLQERYLDNGGLEAVLARMPGLSGAGLVPELIAQKTVASVRYNPTAKVIEGAALDNLVSLAEEITAEARPLVDRAVERCQEYIVEDLARVPRNEIPIDDKLFVCPVRSVGSRTSGPRRDPATGRSYLSFALSGHPRGPVDRHGGLTAVYTIWLGEDPELALLSDQLALVLSSGQQRLKDYIAGW